VIAASGEKTVYLVRHAEPLMPDHVWRFIGARSDPPLSPLGVVQATELTTRFERVRLGAVWSSGLVRSLRTAEIASGLPAGAVRIEPRLREIDLGLWDGLSGPEIEQRFPREYAERESDFVGFRFPEGETFRELQERAVAGFTDLVESALQAGADDILVVAHKSADRVILCHFLDIPLEEMSTIKQDYCAVNVLRAAVDSLGHLRIRVQELAS
jgi:alpha-ribazole phosphatase